MIRLFYNNKYFKIENNYQFSNSNNEVKFSNITIDFTNQTFADIPFKYQEIKVVETDNEESEYNKVIFTGFVDSIKLSQLKNKVEERSLTLSLLSPLKMATLRTATLVGTYQTMSAIINVLEPLINDGFIIKQTNVPEGQITTNFVTETIENCMNTICRKKNLLWYINERKEIFINSIEYLFNLQPKKIIDEDIKEIGLSKLQPSIQNIDYSNIINFKNVRLIYSQYNDSSNATQGFPILNLPKTIKPNEIINFENPIIINGEYLKTYANLNNITDVVLYAFYIKIKYVGGTNAGVERQYSIKMNQSSNNIELIKDGSITFSDDNGTEGEIVLQRDQFFSELITGFKINQQTDETEYQIIEIKSDNALRNARIRFIYSNEINNMKGIISPTGIVEKTIDYNQKWGFIQELATYGRSLMNNNSNEVNEVELEYDENPNLQIGDIVKINANSFYISGNFAVKSINYRYINENDKTWNIICKKADFLTTYIDLFRPIEQQENEEILNNLIISEYIEENMKETHTLEVIE